MSKFIHRFTPGLAAGCLLLLSGVGGCARPSATPVPTPTKTPRPAYATATAIPTMVLPELPSATPLAIKALAPAATEPVAAAMALANLVSGLVVDRVPVRFLLMFALVFQALSLAMVQYLSNPAGAFVFGAVLGATNGIARTLTAVVWPSYFGRSHLASIYGFTSAAGVVGAALGPLPFGMARDLFGTYQGILEVTAGISLLLALWSVTVQRPRRPQEG